MHWYAYIFSLLAGLLIANALPHFVNGISGDGFPTPFAKPPGRGLSSPTVNVIWALANSILGYIFLHSSDVKAWNGLTKGIFFIGFWLMSIMHARNFSKKESK